MDIVTQGFKLGSLESRIFGSRKLSFLHYIDLNIVIKVDLENIQVPSEGHKCGTQTKEPSRLMGQQSMAHPHPREPGMELSGPGDGGVELNSKVSSLLCWAMG